MKKIFIALTAISLAAFLGACGVSNSIIVSHNQNSTQVQLAANNFHVVDKVSGSADVTYVLFFGGINKKQLFENAYSAMMDKANLNNGSKALVNIVTEEHICGVPPFYYKRTVTVCAHIIEFTK